MKFAAISALVLAAFATASPSLEDTGPNPADVYIESLTYGGSGCPQGSVGQSISADRLTFTLIFDNYIATVGPGTPITNSRRNCQLNIKLHVPQGWAYTVFSADYRGYMYLDPKVKGTHKSIYYFAGDTRQVSTESDFIGPQDKDYLAHDAIGVTSLVWSSCGATAALNVNSQVRIDNSANTNGQGQLTTDSHDGNFQHVLGFQWRRC